MKIGAEDKKKLIVMAVLLAIAIPLAIYSFVSVSGSSASSAPEPAAPNPSANRPAQKKTGIAQLRDRTLDPTLHTDLLATSQKIEYNGGKRNIFRMAEVEPVTIPAMNGGPRTPPPAPIITDPPKPQIPLKYYGFSNRPGEAKKAFLQDGDNIFVAVEGEVVERRYKIVKITNSFVLVEDVLNNNQQNINMTAPQTTG